MRKSKMKISCSHLNLSLFQDLKSHQPIRQGIVNNSPVESANANTIVTKLARIISDPTGYRKFIGCRGAEAQVLVNTVQDVSWIIPYQF
jgi:hypothetical protein